MANFEFTSDILFDVLDRASEPTDGSSDFVDQALTYINRAYQAIALGGSEFAPQINETWWWLKKADPGILTIKRPIFNGTVLVTEGSTSITFSVSHTEDLLGRHFKIDDHEDVFKISAHGGGTAATLDSIYTGLTNAAASYKAMKLIYSLATDVLYITSPIIVYRGNNLEISGISEEVMDRTYPLRNTYPGISKAFSMVGEKTIRLSHYGILDEDYRSQYKYLQIPPDLTNTTNETPIIPKHYRKILSDAALFFLYKTKNDDRADGEGISVNNQLAAMQRDHVNRLARISKNYGHIITRPGQVGRFQEPLRTESGLIIG